MYRRRLSSTVDSDKYWVQLFINSPFGRLHESLPKDMTIVDRPLFH